MVLSAGRSIFTRNSKKKHVSNGSSFSRKHQNFKQNNKPTTNPGMNNSIHHQSHFYRILNGTAARLFTVVVLLAGAIHGAAQTTNAYDVASDPAYSGDGPGNGLGSAGNPNGGFGFGAWTFTILNTGGAFINGSGPSGDSFDLWNVSANSSTTAVRPFGSSLAPGQSFSVQTRLNSLDNAGTTNALIFQDASGNTLFSYWHTGFEPNNAVNGQYTDATVTDGAAVGFSYNYQQFQSFTFTLTSSTTYTFTDNSTGHSFTGTIAGTIAQVAFFRGSQGSTGNGQDFQFDQLQIISAAPAAFGGQTPAGGSYSASTTGAISVQVTDGSIPVNTNSIVFKVDGNTVTPTSVSKSVNITTISYTPGSPLSWEALHAAQVTIADNNSVSYTNTWSFTTAYQSLPSVLPGPIVASNQEVGIVIFSTNDAWMGANYGATSGRTIYAQFSMEFDNLNGETGGGGGYGGLQFIMGGLSGAQHVIAGNAWISTNWSFDPNPAPQTDLTPVTPIVFGQWHTIVERVDYSPSANATVTVWLDPDFTQPEGTQLNPPVVVSTVDAFDTVALRTGNGTTSATFSNIVMSATGPFPHAAPIFQNLTPAANDPAAALATPIGAQVVLGTYGIGTNAVALTLDGNPVTPSFTVASNSITVNYQPPTPFAANSSHSVGLSVTDSNGAPYSTSWAFTVDPYPTLPITIPGPINVVFNINGDVGVTLFTSENEWLGTNYQSSSTNTLYTTFAMAFGDLNGETADDQGGCYGGLQFFEGGPEHVGTERMLTGETWLRNTWSIDDKMGGEGGEIALPPTNVVVTFQYHMMAIKSVYSANSNATETVWLDPDFTRSEGNQPNPPLVVSINNTFDTICLRCGNGTANAQFTNIMFMATSPFAAASSTLSIQKSGGSVNLSWTGAGTLQTAFVVKGPWTDSANQANPQVVATTNSATFFRLRP
jgi:hypothetical protein